MECTQRLDYDSSQSERICAEQIGFLGLLGTKYPVMRGPNKVGRDPQTSNIVLDRNSISRQHAVINVLSGTEYMLMDLDSANKTKLNNKTLQAYIPAALSNGDTVQFGEVFGIFRLLEEETDLPCTQALDLPCTQVLDIPDTPVASKHASRLMGATIPESPDISDKDDSFIIPSQPKLKTLHQFKSPSNRLKATVKTFSKEFVGSHKIDIINYSSSKKSNSFNLDDSDGNLQSVPNGDIHNMDTQNPNADPVDESTDSIYSAETQIPPGCSPSIHSLDTQLPVPEHLPTVCKISQQHEMEIDIFAANKENDISIYNAETQFVGCENKCKSRITNDDNIFTVSTQLPGRELNRSPNDDNKSIFTADTQVPKNNRNTNIFTLDTQMPENDNNNKNIFTASTQISDECKVSKNKEFISSPGLKSNSSKDRSDDVIMFDELDSQSFIDDMQSQPLVSSDPFLNQEDNEDDIPLSQTDTIVEDDEDNIKPQETKDIAPIKNQTRTKSGSSTDCEDIDFMPTQKISSNPPKEDDLTDCEDELIEIGAKIDQQSNPPKSPVNFEDLATQVIAEDVVDNRNCKNVCAAPVVNSVQADKFQDLATQVIPEENVPSFEDLATQVISEDEHNRDTNVHATPATNPAQNANFEDLATQVIPDDNVLDLEDLPTQVIEDDTNKPDTETSYSEEVLPSPFKIPVQTRLKMKKKEFAKPSDPKVANITSVMQKTDLSKADANHYAATQEILDDLCTQKEEDSSKKVKYVRDLSTDSSDGDDKVTEFVSRLSAQQITKVIGVEVAKVRKVPSDPSDVEVTPKKVRPFKFMQTELPDSQEIKTTVSLSSKTLVTESSSESEPDNDSQEQTPILFHKKKRRGKANVKTDLTTKFDVTALPTRIITRTRKPTAKLQECDAETLNKSKNLLKSKFLKNADDDVDTEIISENITRLRTKNEKKSHNNVSSENAIDDTKHKPEVIMSDKTDTKTTSRRRDRTKKEENISIDLTKLDDVKTEKVRPKLDNQIIDCDALPGKTKTRRDGKAKNSDKTTTEPKERTETKVKEADSTKKTRETRKNDKTNNNKKDKQEKITNYTVSTVNDLKMSISTSTVDESLNSTSRSTRRTRSRNTEKESRHDEKKSKSPESTKRKRGRPKKEDVDIPEKEKTKDKKQKTETKRPKKEEKTESEPEVRRSKRQQTVKDKSDSIKTPVSALQHEQSTVYNVSSESSADSPKSLKRSAVGDVEVPSPKRTRSSASTVVVSSGVSSNSSSRMSTPSIGVKHCVLFTAFPYENVKGQLEKLGACVVTDVLTCTVVATLQLRRTFKLLCAVGLGKPVVGADWLQACINAQAILDPWQYLLVDPTCERRFGFSLRGTLSGPRGFLRGVTVSATGSVLPAEEEMKLIVECSGGQWHPLDDGKPPPRRARWVAVSCPADQPLWPALERRGATIVSSEFILLGVLTQTFDTTNTRLAIKSSFEV